MVSMVVKNTVTCVATLNHVSCIGSININWTQIKFHQSHDINFAKKAMISRSILLGRLVKNYLPRDITTGVGHQQHRHGSHAFVYRVAPPPAPKSITICADIVGGFMWWWIFWHLWHEYKHITGEFDYPDVSSWTNAELGIPSD